MASAALLLPEDDGLIDEVLAESAALVRTRIAAWLPASGDNRYLYGLLADYPRRSGKLLRSSLCLAATRAWGGDTDDALDTAASIELLHNALLVHDDVEDDSLERRGAPTLHRLHGVPLAVNAGDALGLLALRPLRANAARLGRHLARRIVDETERVAWESAEGQALELGWQHERRTDITEADYLGMVMQKTCWLTTIHPLRAGCLIGARGAAPLEPLIRLGFFFGAAFQIQDDILNLEPGPAYGKEIDGDLREGKRTLMLVHALAHAAPAESARLRRFIAAERGDRSELEVRWVHRLLQRTGSIQHARATANALAGAALREFDHATASLPPGRDLRFIRGLLLWVVRRTR